MLPSGCETCSGQIDGSGLIIDNDIDDDDVCNADELEGCTDATACNYDATPTTDHVDSLCVFSTDLDDCATCSGEQDGTGTIIDYDEDNDGYCNLGSGISPEEIYGCTDSLACNDSFDPEATEDDSSCDTFDDCGVCNGNGPQLYYDCAGNCINDLDNDEVCDEKDKWHDEY